MYVWKENRCARTEYVYVFVYVANGKDHGTVRCTSVDAWLEHGHGIYPNECTFYLHCLSSYADKIKIWMDDEHDVCFAFLTTVRTMDERLTHYLSLFSFYYSTVCNKVWS